MKLFQWFRNKFIIAPLNRAVSVKFDDEAIEFRWAGETTKILNWSDIQRIVIRTTDAGPFDEDVFLILESGKNTFTIPQEAEGATPLLERLQQLPGFDNQAVIDSMCCTDNKVFPCWERNS